jgi:hypothetical protein
VPKTGQDRIHGTSSSDILNFSGRSTQNGMATHRDSGADSAMGIGLTEILGSGLALNDVLRGLTGNRDSRLNTKRLEGKLLKRALSNFGWK